MTVERIIFMAKILDTLGRATSAFKSLDVFRLKDGIINTSFHYGIFDYFLQCFLQYGTLIIIREEALEDEVAEGHHFFQDQEVIQGGTTLAMEGSGMGVMSKDLFQK